MVLVPSSSPASDAPAWVTEAEASPAAVLGQMYDELKHAEAGKRHLLTDELGRVEGGLSQPSTYPGWMTRLVSRKTRPNADKLMAAIDRVIDGKAETPLERSVLGFATDRAPGFAETGTLNPRRHAMKGHKRNCRCFGCAYARRRNPPIIVNHRRRRAHRHNGPIIVNARRHRRNGPIIVNPRHTVTVRHKGGGGGGGGVPWMPLLLLGAGAYFLLGRGGLGGLTGGGFSWPAVGGQAPQYDQATGTYRVWDQTTHSYRYYDPRTGQYSNSPIPALSGLAGPIAGPILGAAIPGLLSGLTSWIRGIGSPDIPSGTGIPGGGGVTTTITPGSDINYGSGGVTVPAPGGSSVGLGDDWNPSAGGAPLPAMPAPSIAFDDWLLGGATTLPGDGDGLAPINSGDWFAGGEWESWGADAGAPVLDYDSGWATEQAMFAEAPADWGFAGAR
jgi:hypothetical protein